MKRKNLVLIILITIVFCLFIGYALFSENINITGTATASGNMQFEILDARVDGDEVTSDYEDVDIIVDGNNITVSGKLLQPGAMLVITGTLKNVGTIDARLSNISTNKENNYDLCKNYNVCSENSDTLMAYRDEQTGVIMYSAILDSSGKVFNDTNLILTADDSSTSSAPIVVAIIWDYTWQEAITEPKEVEFKTTFNFEQVK